MLTKNRSPIYTPAPMPLCAKAFSLLGEVPSSTQSTLNALIGQGYYYNPDAQTTLLLDLPLGFGLHTIQTTLVPSRDLIIVTQNLCPEYWDDLCDFQPSAVVLENTLGRDLEYAFAATQSCTCYRSILPANSRLTFSERKVLRLLACGLSNPQIADKTGVQHKTIRNVLTTIYEKLGVENRTDALLYYWGTWQGYIRVMR